MRSHLTPLYVATTLAALASTAPAQVQERDSVRRTPPAVGPIGQRIRARIQARQGQQGRGQAPLAQATPEQRRAVERRIRQAFQGVVRRRLNLDDAKMRRLQETDLKFEQRRRTLNTDERQARLALRAALEDSVNRDDKRISQAIDNLIAAQRRRTELLEAEQKELSTFLTPFQRAQYLSLQEQVAKRLLEAQQGAAPTARGRPQH